MKRTLAVLLGLLLFPVFSFAKAGDREADRVEEAGEVMGEILNVPDDIPQAILDKAECVIVLPSVKKFAIGVGGNYGRGVMTCRSGKTYQGKWEGAAMYALEGANIGFQLGGQETDFVLLIMNTRGARSVLKSKVKLGADAAAAAGPKGRDAQAATDVVMRAEILSYSRSRGLFAGISLEGTTLRSDGGANENLYGKKLDATDILVRHVVATPPSAAKLIEVLNHHSPVNKSDPRSLHND